jgi:uncharacterized protein YneF (UPF0154 family)
MELQFMVTSLVCGFILGYFLKAYQIDGYIQWRCETCENGKVK